MQKKVSLIIPVFNSERYLDECLESAIGQTLTDIEIICVDDGSTDCSAEILHEYSKKDNRIKILRQENSGQSTARNKGLKFASGEYIAFLDSDDFMKSDMLEKLYNKAKSENSDIIMSDIVVLNEKTGEIFTNDTYLSLNTIPKTLDNKTFRWKEVKEVLFRIPVTPWNKLYKHNFLKENDIFFEKNLNFEDNLFFLKTLILASKISILREALIVYRKFSESSYSTNSGKNDYKKLDMFKLFDFESAFLKEAKAYNELESDFLAYKKETLEYWYKKITDKKIKIEYAKRLYLQYPSKLFENIFKKIKIYTIIKKLNNLTKAKKIMFRGLGSTLSEVITSGKLKYRENILGIIDKNPEKKNKIINGIRVYNYEILEKIRPDVLVISLDNVYNFEYIVKKELAEENIEIETESKIFKKGF